MKRGESGNFPSPERGEIPETGALPGAIQADPPRPSPGRGAALDAIMPVLYAELRQIASAYMRKERSDHTLQPTALVHEAYLRLAGQHQVDWSNRAQVLALAARMMRRILTDHAAGRNAGKRMGRLSRAALEEVMSGMAARFDSGIEFMDLNRALTRLEEIDPQMASIVELRFFGGLTIPEVSEVIGISTATVERDWSTARIWLLRQIYEKNVP